MDEKMFKKLSTILSKIPKKDLTKNLDKAKIILNNSNKEDLRKILETSQIKKLLGNDTEKLKEILEKTDLSKLDTSNGFNADTKDALVDIFNDLDEIKENMSEEGVEQLDNLIKDVISPMLGEAAKDLPINLDEISFAEVDFSDEAEVIDSFYGLMEKAENGEELNTDEVLEEVITNLSDSNLILPILSQVVESLPEEEQLNLSEEDKNKVSEIINGLENQENVDELKALFGIE